MIKKLPLKIVASLLSIALSGCAGFTKVEDTIKSDHSIIKDAQHSIKGTDETSRFVTRHEKPLLTINRMDNEKRYPESFYTAVLFNTNGSQTHQEIIRSISKMSGIPITLDVAKEQAIEQIGSTLPGGASAAKVSLKSGPELLSLNYKGDLKGLLDTLASSADLVWSYNDQTNKIEFFEYESEVISLMLPAGQKTVRAQIGIGSVGTQTEGGSVNIESTNKVDPWASVISSVKIILDGKASPGSGGAASNIIVGNSDFAVAKNGIAVANKDTSQIVVVARPIYLQRVKQLINDVNKRFARNVIIDVRVVELQTNTGTQASLSAQAFTESLGKYSVGVVGSVNQPATGTFPSEMVLAANVPSGKFVIDAVIQALQTTGKVSFKNQGQVVAISGQPAPFQQTNKIAYLKSVKTTVVVNNGLTEAQQDLEQGDIVVGFTANFIPMILPDNRIMLQYQINSSTLIGLKTIEAGDGRTSIQLPETVNQSVQQQAYLVDGQTIALFGFEQARNQADDSIGALSFGKSATSRNTVNIILIQARTASF